MSTTVGKTRRPAPTRGGRPSGFNAWANRNMKWLFAGPALIFTAAMILFPAIYTLVMSTTDARRSLRADFDFVGADNYINLLTASDRFWPAVWRTLVFTFWAVGLELVLGLAIALLLRRKFFGQGAVRTIILMPLVATPVAVAMMWLLIFEPTVGFANEFLSWFGLPPSGWVSAPRTALATLIFIDVWQWTPMVALILLAGLSTLPAEPEEAAAIDRANFWQRLWHIVLPQLRPAIVTAVLLRMIDAIKTFDSIYTLKGRGGGSQHEAETLNILGYSLFFEYNQYGIASAVLVIFLLLIIGIAVALFRFSRIGADS